MNPAERHRHRDDQFTARNGEFAGGLGLRLANLFENTLRRNDIGRARAVSVSLRVDLVNSLVLRSASNSETLRLMVGNGTLSLRLAAEKLPASTEAISKDMASRRSMAPFQIPRGEFSKLSD